MLVLVCVTLSVSVGELVVDIEFLVVPVIPLAVDVFVARENDGDHVARLVELIDELDVPERVPVLLPDVDILDVDVLEEELVCVIFADCVEVLVAHTDQVDVLVNNAVVVQRVVDVCVCVSLGVSENLEDEVGVRVGTIEYEEVPEADDVCVDLPLLLGVELPDEDRDRNALRVVVDVGDPVLEGGNENDDVDEEVPDLEGRDVPENGDAELDFEAEEDCVDDRVRVVDLVEVGDPLIVLVDKDVSVISEDDVGVLEGNEVLVDV